MKKLILLALLIFASSSFAATVEAKTQQVTVSLPTFPITINDTSIDNTHRQYPFIVYKDITYFPMTYNDSRFMGVSTNWTASSGLIIDAFSSDWPYTPDLQAAKNPIRAKATIATSAIHLFGKKIQNDTEPYPLLFYRDVTYFPMTWRFMVDEFNWYYHFTAKEGLILNAPSEQTIPIFQRPQFTERTFNTEYGVLKVQIGYYRHIERGTLKISLNNGPFESIGNSKLVYGMVGTKSDSIISTSKNDAIEYKDGWLSIHAFDLDHDITSRIWSINILTGETK